MYALSEIRLFGRKTNARSQVKILDFIESIKRYHERYTTDLRRLDGEENIPPRLMIELKKVETEIEKILKQLEKLKKKYRIR